MVIIPITIFQTYVYCVLIAIVKQILSRVEIKVTEDIYENLETQQNKKMSLIR